MNVSERLRQEDAVLTQIQSTLTAYESVIGTTSRSNPRKHTVYASSPITTGKRMYDIFQEYDVTSQEQLRERDPKAIFEKIMNPNIKDGQEFGDQLRKKYGIVIVPGDFFAKGWTQEHYMSLWEQVITRYADTVHFNKDWAESNGCVQEFLIGLQQQIPMKERGESGVLTKQAGAGKMRKAIERIDRIGADATVLYNTYRRVELHKNRTIFVASGLSS